MNFEVYKWVPKYEKLNAFILIEFHILDFFNVDNVNNDLLSKIFRKCYKKKSTEKSHIIYHTLYLN